jgi:hypothetical protein
MFALELTAMKEELVCLHFESINDSLSPFYQPAYDLLLGLRNVKSDILLLYIYIYIYIYLYIYVCVCVYVRVCVINKHTCTHIDVDRLSSWKIELGC